MSRKCTKCKKEQDISEFYILKTAKSGYNSWCKSCHRVLKKKYYYEVIKNNPEKYKKYRKEWRNKHKVYTNEMHKKSYEKLRYEVLNHYSNGKIKCNCCGEQEYKFLALDHINGDGNKHRKLIGRGGLYQWIRNNHYPQGFQVLCHNCNFAKGHYGKCPHIKN
jgi:hypothetical protein